MGAVRTPAQHRRGIMAARSYRRLKRYSNSARVRGACSLLAARCVPVVAALMVPSAVLTHLKAGVRAAAEPDPVLMAWWMHPASVTLAKHCNPSLTTVQAGQTRSVSPGSRGRSAKPEMDAPQKLVTRPSLRRTGLPSGVVSTAAANGVLPGAPRPQPQTLRVSASLPPERPPPR